MNQAVNTQDVTKTTIGEWLVRDLVEQYPTTMSLLSPWEIDTCCGGGRKVSEALTLHGAPVDDVLDSIVDMVAAARG
ncbi:MAG: hypothetical protein R2839_01285 [Thermomicrobiales bacterium]